jgi:hypothetical protein
MELTLAGVSELQTLALRLEKQIALKLNVFFFILLFFMNAFKHG